jgi:protein phosphatase 2C family protein 2/3
VTKDHKPEELTEKIRIAAAGGRVYKSSNENHIDSKKVVLGPYRVFPGRLSVSRTLGDPAAKLVKFGGKPGVVIPLPDIFSFEVLTNYDFLILGCDGIFDQLSSQDVVSCICNSVSQENAVELHEQCAIASDCLIKTAIKRHSLDNVTSIIIAFGSFERNERVNMECARRVITMNKSYKVGTYGLRQMNLTSRNMNSLRVETAPTQRFNLSKRFC